MGFDRYDCDAALARSGADAGHVLSGGLTVLHICSDLGLSEAVAALLDNDSGKKCVTLPTQDGQTPLSMAAQSGHEVR